MPVVIARFSKLRISKKLEQLVKSSITNKMILPLLASSLINF